MRFATLFFAFVFSLLTINSSFALDADQGVYGASDVYAAQALDSGQPMTLAALFDTDPAEASFGSTPQDMLGASCKATGEKCSSASECCEGLTCSASGISKYCY
ncbi:MAG: huwentoxin-IV family protein [Rhodospirillaceae bacterium]